MSEVTVVGAVHQCALCRKTREKPPAPRIPKGWKHHTGLLYCDDCWHAQYLLRAVVLPVASPVGLAWKDLDKELKRMWAATTNCSNWMMTQLYVHDYKRIGNDTKLPRMERRYLYPEARVLFPELPSQTVASLEQAITSKYVARRLEVVWSSQAALPTYKYPTPFPVHNQSWSVDVENEKIVLSVRLGNKRVSLRLKSGPQFRRQRHAVEQIVAGTAVRGECAIYKKGTATMAKLVAWLPRQTDAGSPRKGMLVIRTQADSLLVAVNLKDERIWTYNADHVRRWEKEHARELHRWSEDQKAEDRPVPDFGVRRTAAVQKYKDRMNTACQQISAYLANYAARRRFATVSYDDHEHGFSPGFPYAHLRELIQQKLDSYNIEFQLVEQKAASGEVKEKSPNRSDQEKKP